MRHLRLLCSLTASAALAACGGSVANVPAQTSWNVHPYRTASNALPAQHLYVAQGNYYNKIPGAVLVFALTANGNAAPVRQITGSHTMLYQPRGVAVDSKGRIYAANEGESSSKLFSWDNKIFIFGPAGTGNLSPAATMTNLVNPTAVIDGLYLDAHNNVYVVRNEKCTCIDVYQAGVSPAHRVRYLTASTADFWVGGAFDASGQFYVGVDNLQASAQNGSVDVFGPSGNNVNPVRQINGYATYLDNVIDQVTIDGDFGGRILVEDGGGIKIFAIGASGDAGPVATIDPTSSKLPHANIVGVAVDRNHNIYALDQGDNAILVFPPTANGNVAPKAIIEGALTKLNQPVSIAIY